MNEIKLLNVKEAAQVLKLSPHTLRLWVLQRKVPTVRLGRRVLFEYQELVDYVNRNKIEERPANREFKSLF